MARIVVVGSGISGLSTAEWLGTEHEVMVLEAGPHPGGNVQSETVDGFVFDKAANGWLDNEPLVAQLIERIQATDQVLKAQDGTRYVVQDGRLVALPMKPQEFLLSPVLPWWAKLRIALEPFIGRHAGEETVAQFVRRRLGQQALENLVGPMVSGVYAGDPEQLSLDACFPRLRELETEHRSLILAMRALKSDNAGPSGKLTTLHGGAGELTRRLACRLDTRCDQPVTRLERHGEGWRVGDHEADAVVLACPAWASADLVRGLDLQLAASLEAIPYVGVAVVCSGLPRAGWSPPQGFGALIPQKEGFGILGTLFTGHIFPGHAPEDGVALRSILGGALNPMQATLPPAELGAIARKENERLLGKLPPARVERVYQHGRGIPQYVLGHPARVASIREREAQHPGLFLTGNHLHGIGVKNCVADSKRCADRVLEHLA